MDFLGWQVCALVIQNFFEDAGFVWTAGQEGNVGGAVQNGQGKGDAVGVEFFHPVGNDQTTFLSERGSAREKRSGVAVGTQAEQYEIEAGKLAGLQAEKLPQSLVVIQSRGVGIFFFGGDAKYVVARNLRKQSGFASHAVVTLGIVRQHKAFIAEEEENLIPRNVRNRAAG